MRSQHETAASIQPGTRTVGAELQCYLECINTEGDNQPAMDLCRIHLDTGRITTSDKRTPLIWYDGEIALQLYGQLPTFAIKRDPEGLFLTKEALSELKASMRKPFSTSEFEETVPLEGALGQWEGCAVERGKKYRILVITGAREHIERTRMRQSAESKGWVYRICATIDIDSVHLVMFKPVAEVIASTTPAAAPAAEKPAAVTAEPLVEEMA